MKNDKEWARRILLEKELISEGQANEIEAYSSLKIFSLRTELQLLLYFSVLLFTSGVGIIIYRNIDTIGHMATLVLILIAIALCFYFCFKNAGAYSDDETDFANPVFNYILLAANILTCIFIGYLQFQYTVFGTHYGLVTLLPTLIALTSAYYFDNKSVLSLGLTGLAAYVGLSVSPQSVLSGDLMDRDIFLSLSAFGLGVALMAWAAYTAKWYIKPHFYFIFATFSLHLVALSLLKNCYGNGWFIVLVLLAVSTYFFYKVSVRIPAISIFVFNLFYAYVGFNSLLVKLVLLLNLETAIFELWQLLVILLPVYIIVSIVLFIKAIKNFNKNKANENI